MFVEDDRTNDQPSDQPKQITINFKRLRMRDLQGLKKSASEDDLSFLVPILSRVTGLTEDEVWDLDIETMVRLQTELSEAMENVAKKANGGN
jgi:hypothetical protein